MPRFIHAQLGRGFCHEVGADGIKLCFERHRDFPFIPDALVPLSILGLNRPCRKPRGPRLHDARQASRAHNIIDLLCRPVAPFGSAGLGVAIWGVPFPS